MRQEMIRNRGCRQMFEDWHPDGLGISLTLTRILTNKLENGNPFVVSSDLWSSSPEDRDSQGVRILFCTVLIPCLMPRDDKIDWASFDIRTSLLVMSNNDTQYYHQTFFGFDVA